MFWLKYNHFQYTLKPTFGNHHGYKCHDHKQYGKGDMSVHFHNIDWIVGRIKICIEKNKISKKSGFF